MSTLSEKNYNSTRESITKKGRNNIQKAGDNRFNTTKTNQLELNPSITYGTFEDELDNLGQMVRKSSTSGLGFYTEKRKGKDVDLIGGSNVNSEMPT